MKTKRPTQSDVARRAGVSRSTVSIVLNKTDGNVPISQKTQERVLTAAKELGYSPNLAAQMLARGSTRILGVFPLEGTIPYTLADFYYPYLVGIEREAAHQDYNVLLFTRNQAKKSNKIYQDEISSLRLADGLILTGNYPDPTFLRWMLEENYPFVLIGRSTIPHDEIDTVVNDHKPTSYEATRHLIDLNHQNLGLLVDDLNLAYHQERLAGCEKAVSEAENVHLTIFTSQILVSETEFISAIRSPNISGLICADRKLNSTTVDLLQKIPVQVPEDLSLVFLVSNTWDLPFVNPTRVNLNRDVKGRVAVQRLTKRLEGAMIEYQQIQVPCQFVIGDTTAPR